MNLMSFVPNESDISGVSQLLSRDEKEGVVNPGSFSEHIHTEVRRPNLGFSDFHNAQAATSANSIITPVPQQLRLQVGNTIDLFVKGQFKISNHPPHLSALSPQNPGKILQH